MRFNWLKTETVTCKKAMNVRAAYSAENLLKNLGTTRFQSGTVFRNYLILSN